MSELFVVEIIGYEVEERDNIVRKFITDLRISPNKAIKMLDRLPRAVTKPIPFDKAKDLKDQFDSVGVEVQLKAYGNELEAAIVSDDSSLKSEPSIDTKDHLQSVRENTVAPEQAVANDPLANDEPRVVPLEQEEMTTPLTKEGEEPVLIRETDYMDKSKNSEDQQAVLEEVAEDLDVTLDSQRKHKYSVRGIFLLCAILPALLVALGLWLVLLSTIKVTLNAQTISAAQQHAIFIANHLENELDTASALGSSQNLTILQNNIQLARQSLSGSNISFAAATDNKGQTLTSWFNQPENIIPISQNIKDGMGDILIDLLMVQSQGIEPEYLIGGGSLKNRFYLLGYPIVLQGQISGVIFLGLNKRDIVPQLQRLFLSMFLITLLMLILAFLLASLLGRNLINDVINLTNVADKLSCGDLDVVAEAKSNTELAGLAKALERIKGSFKLSLERWRTHRG